MCKLTAGQEPMLDKSQNSPVQNHNAKDGFGSLQ